MLQAQVAYWTLMENVRHNKATEGITTDTLAETIRHNRASEAQGRESLRQGWSTLGVRQAEVRANIQRNALQKQANDIAYMNAMSNAANAATNRYNAETNRALGYANLAISRQNAQSQATQASASATQAYNSAVANNLRQQELGVRKVEVFANYTGNYVGNLMRLGGSLLK